MKADDFRPTGEQKAIIRHDGHAFVHACPGAGKTRTMVERARHLLTSGTDRRGVAFLSFTNAAVDELAARLASFGALPAPLFPGFIGTFDRFLWQFLIAPFGLDGCSQIPRLVPDKKDWEIRPFDRAQALKLRCFDRSTGAIILEKAAETGFAPRNGPKAWETAARKVIADSLTEGRLDFDDVRDCVRHRLEDKGFAARVGAALASRFREIVVDEAQDCNPTDLEIITWLRVSGIVVKIICDPNQAIYGFRGGLTNQLQAFADTFEPGHRLPMSGNFRSSPAICAAISQLRPPASRTAADKPLGRYKDEAEPVYVLAYGGTSVSPAIGAKFQEMATGLGIASDDAQLLASTWASASNAAGRKMVGAGQDKKLLLAEAVMGFLYSFEAGNRREALSRLHRVVLLIRGHIANAGAYSTHLTKPEHEGGRWREEVIRIGQALRVKIGETEDQWLARARGMLDHDLVGGSTIGQRLKRHAKLATALATTEATALPARTIHSVKGLEFPAVCVVLTPRTAGGILDVLTGTTTDPQLTEDARKIYVAASRAERLLAIAIPNSRVAGFKRVLDDGGNAVTVVSL